MELARRHTQLRDSWVIDSIKVKIGRRPLREGCASPLHPQLFSISTFKPSTSTRKPLHSALHNLIYFLLPRSHQASTSCDHGTEWSWVSFFSLGWVNDANVANQDVLLALWLTQPEVLHPIRHRDLLAAFSTSSRSGGGSFSENCIWTPPVKSTKASEM